MKAAAGMALLLVGCTSVYGGAPPVGCETEDGDGDGFLSEACLGAGNALADCDDDDAEVFPDATERCNGRDDDCDGAFDEGLGTTVYADCDGDAVGSAALAETCDATLLDPPTCPDGVGQWVAEPGDCDDADDTVQPGAAERCDARDDDCDGAVDEALPTNVFYADCDGDAVGGDASAESCDFALLGAPACEAGGAWVTDPGDCDDDDPSRQLSCGACGAVDVLLIVDNAAGAAPLQGQLSALLPELLAPLSTGDLDGDGAADVEPLASLQLGMVTTDMGSRGFDQPSCRDADFGDDGVLITMPEGCADAVPPYSTLDPGGDLAGFTDDARCHATAGELGCLYGMPLESGLRALTPASSLRRFHPFPAGLGHGDLANAGMLREDSVLLVVLVTDADDCSVEPGQESLFDPSGGNDLPPGPIRCALDEDALHAVARYTSGFLALRDARDLVLAVVAGVPSDLVSGTPDVAAYDAILSDPRMIPTQSPTSGALLPSCTGGGGVTATPPVRLVSLARGLAARGAATELGSVCDPTPAALGGRLVDALLDARDRRCVAE